MKAPKKALKKARATTLRAPKPQAPKPQAPTRPPSTPVWARVPKGAGLDAVGGGAEAPWNLLKP